MKIYIVSEVMDREISTPKVFYTIDEAKAYMFDCFCQVYLQKSEITITDKDKVLEWVSENSVKDEHSDEYEYADDGVMNLSPTFAFGTFAGDGQWDIEIHEVEI